RSSRSLKPNWKPRAHHGRPAACRDGTWRGSELQFPRGPVTATLLPRAEIRTLNSTTVLVSGAAGLLGSDLVPQLRQAGCHVRAVDLRSVDGLPREDIVVGDLLDNVICRRACEGADTIVHTAARQHHSGMPRWGRGRFFEANIKTTYNLVQVALAAGVRH